MENDSELFYIHDGKRINLTPSKEYFAVSKSQIPKILERNSKAFGTTSYNANIDIKANADKDENSALARAGLLLIHQAKFKLEKQEKFGNQNFPHNEHRVSRSDSTLVLEDGPRNLVLFNEFNIAFDVHALKSKGAGFDKKMFLEAYNLEIVDAIGFLPQTFIVKSTQNSKVLETLSIINSLNSDPFVDYAEPNFISFLRTEDTASDKAKLAENTFSAHGFKGAKESDLQHNWALNTLGVSNSGCFPTGQGVTVAIIDTGVEARHPELSIKADDYMVAGAPRFDRHELPDSSYEHGTNVAGIISASGLENRIGVRGVAPRCRMLSAKVGFRAEGKVKWVFKASDVLDAISWAKEEGADIINMSFGLANSECIRKHIIAMGREGILFVVAAGNYGAHVPSFPATLSTVVPELISVSATNYEDRFVDLRVRSIRGNMPDFKSYRGLYVNVAAPGLDISTTDLTGDLGRDCSGYTKSFYGTSAAAAFVSGAAALVKETCPDISPQQIRNCIEETADYLPPSNIVSSQEGEWNEEYGFGRLNIEAAVNSCK